MRTIKPLDTTVLLAAARETGALVTAEEHSIVGGLGGAVAEALAATAPVPIEGVGIEDCFATSFPYPELLEHFGLTADAIVAAALRTIAVKRRADRSSNATAHPTTAVPAHRPSPRTRLQRKAYPNDQPRPTTNLRPTD